MNLLRSLFYVQVLISVIASLKLISLNAELASKPFLLIFAIAGHPLQVPWWLSNFAPGIKTKFKDFSGDLWKKIVFTCAR